ncbi:MAG: hypothetical protein AAF624_11395 [Bacteroidota bacterium]
MSTRKFAQIDTAGWPHQIGHPEFVALVQAYLPEVAARMRELDATGLLHVAMGVLEGMTIQAYNDRLNVARRYLAFADEVLPRADAAVLNALDVSFVEGLVFGGRDQGIRDWMPERLLKEYDAQRKARLSGKDPALG